MRIFTITAILALLVASLSAYLAQTSIVHAQTPVETTVTEPATPTVTQTPTPTLTPPATRLAPLISNNWISFYGRAIQFNNQPVPPGKIIEAYDSNGRLCGSYQVDTTGKYGFLTCALDNPNTAVNEGVAPGEIVYFKVDGQAAGTFQLPAQLKSGARFNATPVMVPEPLTIVLFGTGLLGLAVRVRRRNKQSIDHETAEAPSHKGDPS